MPIVIRLAPPPPTLVGQIWTAHGGQIDMDTWSSAAWLTSAPTEWLIAAAAESTEAAEAIAVMRLLDMIAEGAPSDVAIADDELGEVLQVGLLAVCAYGLVRAGVADAPSTGSVWSPDWAVRLSDAVEPVPDGDGITADITGEQAALLARLLGGAP